jgi:hypothetical protein
VTEARVPPPDELGAWLAREREGDRGSEDAAEAFARIADWGRDREQATHETQDIAIAFGHDYRDRQRAG